MTVCLTTGSDDRTPVGLDPNRASGDGGRDWRRESSINRREKAVRCGGIYRSAEVADLAVRYGRRQTSDGYVVFDFWTGETVVIAGAPQDDLSSLDSEDLVRLLNQRAAAGTRDLLQ
jgi:hypothetical protein